MDDDIRCGEFVRMHDEGILFYIFSLLGLHDLFRLRSVCKSWSRAILSPQFASIYKIPQEPWCVLRVRTQRTQYREDYFDYDLKLPNHVRLWQLAKGGNPIKTSLPLGPPGSKFVGLSSSNGLVCGRLMEHKDTLVLAVGNPLTNTWTILPPSPMEAREIPRPAYLPTYMVYSPDSNTYKVVVIYCKQSDVADVAEGPLVHIIDDPVDWPLCYDSRTRSWEFGPAFYGEKDLVTSGSGTVVGDACCYSCSSQVIAYDTSSRRWSCNANSRPVNLHPDCDKGSLWEDWRPGLIGYFIYKGRLYAGIMLCLLLQGECTELELGISIWIMDYDSGSWKLVSRVPSRAAPREVPEKDFKLELVGDTVVISNFYRMESYGDFHAVAFNLTTKVWTECKVEEEDGQEVSVECSYSFIPSLTAIP